MADYGVGGPDWSALPWSWAGERLAGTRNYWVVTADAHGQPHSMPVWGVWDDEELRFVFSCAPTAKKARNIAVNPRVTFTNDDTVEAVSVQGIATLVTDAARIETWVQRIGAKYADAMGEAAGDTTSDTAGDDLAEFMRQNALIEVVPAVAFAMIERADEFATRATRWRFG